MPIYIRRAGSSPAPDTSKPLGNKGFSLYLKAIRRKIDHMQFIHLDSIDDERVSAYTNSRKSSFATA